MNEVDPAAEPQPPRGHVRMVYLGPVAPHWDVYSDFGERFNLDEPLIRQQGFDHRAATVTVAEHDFVGLRAQQGARLL